ncbi:hypothetical protein HYS00_04100 [Candidatus Microgenomates bacterium]|nr:hypothetical protein [Candidatus Microgenomates bacterium]
MKNRSLMGIPAYEKLHDRYLLEITPNHHILFTMDLRNIRPAIGITLGVFYTIFTVAGGYALHYAVSSRAAVKKPFQSSQQQGSLDKFISPSPQPSAKTNNLVECGYAPSGAYCVPSNPKTCLVWNESKILAASQNPGPDGVLHAWYTDEHAISLGKGTVSPLNAVPDHVVNPVTGDPAGADPSGRPIRPALFITDITTNPADRSGDWENGGKLYEVSELYGTWKALNDADPRANGTNLGPGSVAMPAGSPDLFVSEIRWNLKEPQFGLQTGHTYRLEFMLHDGDQSNGGQGGGGDAGEKCSTITL